VHPSSIQESNRGDATSMASSGEDLSGDAI
jgi:hypothetical protein